MTIISLFSINRKWPLTLPMEFGSSHHYTSIDTPQPGFCKDNNVYNIFTPSLSHSSQGQTGQSTYWVVEKRNRRSVCVCVCVRERERIDKQDEQRTASSVDQVSKVAVRVLFLKNWSFVLEHLG
jgi:hypothetical protein